MPPTRIIYVGGFSRWGGGENGGSWANAYSDLQTAINAASAGTEIWVATGNYYGPFTLKDGVALYGGFVGTETSRDQRQVSDGTGTMLSGEVFKANNPVLGPDAILSDRSTCFTVMPPDPSLCLPMYLTRHVVTAVNVTSRTVLDGFLITDGWSEDYGGGMYNIGGSPTLNNVIFFHNYARSGGGGMYNDGGSPTLTNVIFVYNVANYASLLQGDSMKGNFGYGGGMYNRNSSPTLINVTFRGNIAKSGGGGGAIYTTNGFAPTLINSLLDANTGGLLNQYSGAINATTSWLSPNTTSAAQVHWFGTKTTSAAQGNLIVNDFDASEMLITNPTGLQIGTNCPASDLMRLKRANPCTVGALEFTGQFLDSSPTANQPPVPLLTTAAGSVMLDLPPKVFPEPIVLAYIPTSILPTTTITPTASQQAQLAFTLNATNPSTFQPLPNFAFTAPVTLTLPTAATTQTLELRRFDASQGVWTTAGIRAAGVTATSLAASQGVWTTAGITAAAATTTSLSFTLTQMGQYALFPVPTSVWIEARASSPAGLQAIPGGTPITYTLTLHNASQAIASGVTVSDTLPLGVTFANWVSQDTATFDGTRINWQPGAIAAGGSASISFTVNSSSVAPYLGRSIINTAAYSLGDTSASAQVALSLNGPPSLSDISMTTLFNTALTINPLLLGVSNPDGSPITMSIGTPQHGAATLVGDTIIYTPTTGFLGNDSLSYTVHDASFQVSAAVQVRVANLAFPFLMQQVDNNRTAVLPGQTLTYQLTVGNGAELALKQGTITVTLPISLTFGTWLHQDTATRAGNTITWGPSDVALNTTKSISFTVTVDWKAEGTLIPSTAYLTAANADPASDTLTLDVITPQRMYLPVIRR